jgi:hypothetical protein
MSRFFLLTTSAKARLKAWGNAQISGDGLLLYVYCNGYKWPPCK